ncbi:MAG: diguanylate cyclase [Hydrocarboniphaga sp.]|uniref:putative bifunctional diguanylate cyclase/phosphodiesterase n=1 Tax=Hydrocarboniphaga sp. TaxID=2033016 RepID=UPI00260239C6|nr:EAL domain-containing protein [Hydrocarboniphaga sp.]MDB5972012.1 diguanylate cyclase [Hydrocarboniphaga sp.]
MSLDDHWPAATATLRRRLGHATEPQVLFPAAAVLVLVLIWGTTLNLIRVERAAAEHSVAASSSELAETYEAQVVRALREIDQTLKFVKYAYEREGETSVLNKLKARGLLPTDLLFVVSITDSAGDVVASTRASAASPPDPSQLLLQLQRAGDSLLVSRPQRSQGSEEWTLQFSRRLDPVDGRFAGLVMLEVDAAYFVSGYESSKLGEYGVLGILGTDGVFRVRRSGETLFAGDTADYAAVVSAAGEADSEARLSINPWDGVRRYTSASQLYDFPLAVIVGLSADEQLADLHRAIRAYLWRASAVSLALMLVVAVLGRLSWQLALSRRRAIDEQIAHAERVEYLAYHDALTGLPNRSLFSKLLIQSVSEAQRYERRLAVLFLDLDRFKHINDTLGHEAGDHLLQEVATRLRACLRDSDAAARLGGDEFVVLLPELDEEKYIALVAQKILTAIARPVMLLGQEFRITASIGISSYPQDGLDEQTLKKHADIAMYQAKEEGKNNFQFYSEKLNASSLERLTLESGLRHALERDEFQLHYQAKRDIGSGRITGMEALLRWQHPDLGTVAPMQFIAAAEETGQIVAIGRWVLKTACLQNVAWQKQGLPHLSMAVNLSARQFFDENLLADLGATVAATGMDPQLLELEISESLLMRDVDSSLRILTGLKNMGVRIAIDDFGIGYSSLSTLKQFPLDTIKIDRSFIRDVDSVAEDKDLTEAIIAMGRTLSLTVVAQGVETKEQADYLRQNACDEFQGFYFNKPVPADQIAELLRAQSLIGSATLDWKAD